MAQLSLQYRKWEWVAKYREALLEMDAVEADREDRRGRSDHFQSRSGHGRNNAFWTNERHSGMPSALLQFLRQLGLGHQR